MIALDPSEANKFIFAFCEIVGKQRHNKNVKEKKNHILICLS